MQYVSAYIQVKNCFETYDGGYEVACRNFNDAFDWAKNNPYSSLGEFLGSRSPAIVDFDEVESIFETKNYKNFCKDFIEGRASEEDPTFE